MLQLLSKIKIADNSGVVIGKTIKILKPKDSKIGLLGDLILLSSQGQIQNSGIRPGTLFKALIVQTRKKNKNGHFYLRWEDNYVVLVKLSPKGDEFLPVGTRIKTPIPTTLKNKKGYQKVVSLSKFYV